MQNQNKNSNLPIEEPIYVYFDYHGTKVSELFIPTETKSLSDLITENSFKYKIPIDLFHDLVLKNRINLSENNSYQTKNQKDLKLQEPVFNNFLEANDHLNSNNSTRCNTNKNLKGLTNNNNNNFPNSHENLEMPKQHNNKERIYNEILAFKENEIPKNKLLELTSNLLKNTNKYLKDHKNQNNDLTANANFVDKFDIRNDYNTNSVDRHKTDLHNDYNNYDNMINLNNNKSLNEVNSLNQIQLSNKNNNKINNNSNSDKNKTESKTKHNLNIINNHNNKINAANNNVDLIKKALLRSGANVLKSPRSVKIDLNMISGKSNNKSQGKKVNQTKSKADKGNLEKEHQSPNYNFLHTNNLLVKNYKRANNYADKEAFAKQIKGQMNQERLSAIKDSKTYAVYNYKKIIPENVHNSTNQETEEKKRNCLTNPVDNVLIDLNSKNENENEQAVIDDLELKLIDYNNYNNNNYNKTEQIEQTKAFNDTELNNVNMYNDLNNIISQNYNNINSNFNMPAKKISQSNAQYVSLKNKLDNLSNDYILNFNNKNNNNLFSSKNMIDNLLNLNLNTANNANDKNNNQNEKTQPNNFDNKNIKNNNNINFNFNNENQEEKFIGSETMSEKSSFLFNTHRKASENYQTANTNPNKNANYSINNFKANNLNNNLNTTTNLNENTNRTNYKSLSRGANLIKKLKKNQSSFSVSKSERSVSYGERLFYKGKLFEEQKGKKTEIYKKMKEIEFEKNCTFKPKINPNSIALSVKANFSKLGASSFGYADGILNNFSTPNLLNNKNNANNIYNQDENFENNLYHSYNNFENLSNFNHSGNFSNNHYNNNNGLMQNIRYKNKQCSHNPMLNNTVNFNENYKASLTGINSTSKILNKTSFKSPEEIEIVSKRLHDNAERYRNKKLLLQENYYAQTCPFSPEIISREEGVIPNMENFFNRLQNWVDKRNDKYEQDLDKKHFDQITGNRLFSPQINRSSKHNVSFNIETK